MDEARVCRSAVNGFTSLRRSAQQGFTLGWRSAQQGFTLLEMLVALSVFSLAALALIRLQAVAIRSAADLESRHGAQVVAANMMVEIMTDPALPPAGQAQSIVRNGGRDWRLVRLVQPMPGGKAVRVVVTVDGAASAGRAVLSFVRAP